MAPLGWNLAYYLLSYTMAPLNVACVSAAVWKWFCGFFYAIGPVHDISSDEEFYTPPTTPLRVAKEQLSANVLASSTTLTPHIEGMGVGDTKSC